MRNGLYGSIKDDRYFQACENPRLRTSLTRWLSQWHRPAHHQSLSVAYHSLMFTSRGTDVQMLVPWYLVNSYSLSSASMY